ncbi:MAG: DUF2293 domain-containing protein [Planctomycetota bacterium]|jgi:hypothetical protein
MRMDDRIEEAVRRAFHAEGYVSLPLLLREIGFLSYPAYSKWINREESNLFEKLQCGEAKLKAVIGAYRNMIGKGRFETTEPMHLLSTAASVSAAAPAFLNRDEICDLFKLACLSPDLTDRKRTNLKKKLAEPPELKVFILTGDPSTCEDCGCDLDRGAFIYLEGGGTYCLSCADLDELEFLPRGDAALSRRAKKHSDLHAVVLEFSRRRKRYERQGLLVEPVAIAMAEEECRGDADKRAIQREKSAERRVKEDRVLVKEMSARIAQLYPGCPGDEAHAIAQHAAVRGSGRVGRSAAGRALDDEALTLAAIAHIRHTHTEYDHLLDRGTPRREARQAIAGQLDQVRRKWEG